MHKSTWLRRVSIGLACGMLLLSMPLRSALAAGEESTADEASQQTIQAQAPESLWSGIFALPKVDDELSSFDYDASKAVDILSVNANAILLTRPVTFTEGAQTKRWMPLYWSTEGSDMQLLYEYINSEDNSYYYGTQFTTPAAATYTFNITFEEQLLIDNIWQTTGKTFVHKQLLVVVDPIQADITKLDATVAQAGENVILTAVGSNVADHENTPRVVGETRYVAAYYQLNGGPLRLFDDSANYTATLAATKTPMTFTVTFRLQTWTADGWQNEGTITRIYRTVQPNAAT